MENKQLDLIPGYFHCHNCGRREVTHVRPSGRFRLCNACYTAIVPDLPDGQAHTDAQRQQIAAYWDWRHQMALCYPVPTTIRTVQPVRSIPANSDCHNPTCACGQPRRLLPHTSKILDIMTNPNRYTEIKTGEVRIRTGTSSHLDDDVVLGTEIMREAEITAHVNRVMSNYLSYLYAVGFLTGKPPIISTNDDNST